MDPLNLYERASEWTKSKIEATKDKLDAPTACDEWDARALVNHLVAVKDTFVGAAQGNPPSGPPSGPPPEVIGDDPVADFEDTRQAILEAFRPAEVQEKQGMMLGIAFADTLLHGWDLASKTGQDATMPEGLAEAAYGMLNGQLSPERRGDAFKPEISVPDDADVQTKLLAYTGRQP